MLPILNKHSLSIHESITLLVILLTLANIRVHPSGFNLSTAIWTHKPLFKADFHPWTLFIHQLSIILYPLFFFFKYCSLGAITLSHLLSRSDLRTGSWYNQIMNLRTMYSACTAASHHGASSFFLASDSRPFDDASQCLLSFTWTRKRQPAPDVII